ncbi:MAG: nicotinamide riboside transporter PnuC [Bacteroidota bacterium]
MLSYLTFYNIIEFLGAVCSIIYSVLLIREKSIGWFFGIASSILGIILFIESKIYAQAIISVYYAGIGVYGWLYWKKAEQRNEHIHKWKPIQHFMYAGLFVLLSLLSAYLFETYTDSQNPYLDSFVTLFGFLASIKEARKILTSWVYWFGINAFSVVLYYNQHLYFYSGMMVLYALICIPGYLNWKKIYNQNQTTSV